MIPQEHDQRLVQLWEAGAHISVLVDELKICANAVYNRLRRLRRRGVRVTERGTRNAIRHLHPSMPQPHLTPAQVREIRRLFADNDALTYVEVARQYDVPPHVISRVVRRLSYKKVL